MKRSFRVSLAEFPTGTATEALAAGASEASPREPAVGSSVSPLPRLILANLNCSRRDTRFVPNFDFALFSRPDILEIGENGVVHKLEMPLRRPITNQR